jgi:hypothetical protein
MLDIVKGASLSPSKAGDEGGHYDFDLGSTYLIGTTSNGWKLHTGAAITHMLDGHYQSINIKWFNVGESPRQQPRTYGVGISGTKQGLWKFTQVIVAAEISDIGNNPNGSLFRTVHLGAEAEWKSLRPRVGLNQGYWAAGLGFHWRAIDLEFASYGEELTLNVGGKEDRRYVGRFSISI